MASHHPLNFWFDPSRDKAIAFRLTIQWSCYLPMSQTKFLYYNNWTVSYDDLVQRLLCFTLFSMQSLKELYPKRQCQHMHTACAVSSQWIAPILPVRNSSFVYLHCHCHAKFLEWNNGSANHIKYKGGVSRTSFSVR